MGVTYNPSRPKKTKKKKKVKKWKQGLKRKCIGKKVSNDFTKHFYFQFDGFKTLGSEVF